MSKELFQQLIDSKVNRINDSRLITQLNLKIDLSEVHNSRREAIDGLIYLSAKYLKRTLRKHDSCTLANNELTLLLPNTSSDDAGRAGVRFVALLKNYLARAGITPIKLSFAISTISAEKPQHLYWHKQVSALGGNNIFSKRPL